VYTSKPLTIPDSNCVLADFSDFSIASEATDYDTLAPDTSLREAITPCPNLSTFYFLYWFWKGSNKSIASREELRTNVILQPDFNPRDLAGINLQAIDAKLAAAAYSQPGCDNEPFKKSDGWIAKSISIQVPVLGKGKASRALTSQFVSVPGALISKFIHILPNTNLHRAGLHSRKILSGIRRGFSRNNINKFHYEPFQEYWVLPEASKADPNTIMGEIYTSRVMLDAHKEVQRLNISDQNCKLPRMVAAVMLGSDALQLGMFSTKKAWVLYMWLGNLSKYECCKPNSNSCFELAHIPSVSNFFLSSILTLNTHIIVTHSYPTV
jgi:hypothetical protein